MAFSTILRSQIKLQGSMFILRDLNLYLLCNYILYFYLKLYVWSALVLYNTSRLMSSKVLCNSLTTSGCRITQHVKPISITAPYQVFNLFIYSQILKPHMWFLWYQISAVNTRLAHQINASDSKPQHGSHDKLWAAERFLSAGLLAILPVGILFPSQPLDALMAVSIVLHQYW